MRSTIPSADNRVSRIGHHLIDRVQNSSMWKPEFDSRIGHHVIDREHTVHEVWGQDEASSSGMSQFEGSSFTVLIRWSRITTTLAFNMQIIENTRPTSSPATIQPSRARTCSREVDRASDAWKQVSQVCRW